MKPISRIAATLLAASGLIATTAGAAEKLPTARLPSDPAVTISFGDLNPANRDGAQRLYQRIRSAAQLVCGTPSSATDPQAHWTYRDCYRATIARAVEQVNWPTLTAVHLAAQPRGSKLQREASR